MATRAAKNAIADTVGDWIAGLSFTPIDGGADYSVTVRKRPPKGGDAIAYPTVGVVVSGEYENVPRSEAVGSRSPAEGDGTYLEKVGEFLAKIQLVIYADSENREDEIVGGIELALMPEDSEARRVDLTATDYHDQIIALRRRSLVNMTFQGTAEQGVWRPVINCDAAIAVVRSTAAADFKPQTLLNPDKQGEYTLDHTAGTTTPPA